jgi:hypothetical protein
VAADLQEINTETPFKILDFFLFANGKVGAFVGDVPLHTDDNMAVEYLSGRALSKSRTSYDNYIALLNYRTPVTDYLVNLESAVENKDNILKELEKYWVTTGYNLKGQQLFREGKRKEAFELFNRIPGHNPDDKEPVEYFGASYQEAFLTKARVVNN